MNLNLSMCSTVVFVCELCARRIPFYYAAPTGDVGSGGSAFTAGAGRA